MCGGGEWADLESKCKLRVDRVKFDTLIIQFDRLMYEEDICTVCEAGGQCAWGAPQLHSMYNKPDCYP